MRTFRTARLAGLILASAATALASSFSRPNIVVILADDLGYADLGVQGCRDIPTPNLDALAKSGARFTDAYVTCPICAPSRAGLITGRYQARYGFEDIGGTSPDPQFGLPESETTLARRLRNVGYATGAVGKWDLGVRTISHPNAVGFDFFFGFLPGANDYLRKSAPGPGLVNGRRSAILRNAAVVDEPEYLTDAFGREAAQFVTDHAQKPFFLYLAFNAPHTPLEAPEKYLQRFPALSGGRRTYAAMVSAMDDAVGHVLAALNNAKVRENTLIFFLSDNGGPSGGTSTEPNFSSNQPLRGYKATFFEGGIRVPYFVSWPTRIAAGQVIGRITSSLDIAASSLVAADASAPPSTLDGENLLPWLTGDSRVPVEERTLFWRYFGSFAIRRGEWKATRVAAQPPKLYHLQDDRSETRELATTQPTVLQSLTSDIEAWEAKMQAPRWQRRFVSPTGEVTLKPLPLPEEHAAIDQAPKR